MQRTAAVPDVVVPEPAPPTGRRPAGRVGRGLVAGCALLVASVGVAAEPVSKSRLGGVAIGGHDHVAYRQLPAEPHGEAVEGERSHAVEHLGATWRFASGEDAAAFAADPDRYVPAYNGHCANALSLGEGLVRTDGTHREIFDGDDRLYLFHAGRGRDRWVGGDWQDYRAEADQAWESLGR